MKEAYYKKWSQEEQIKVFGKRLNDDQCNLTNYKIIINDKDKLKFYIQDMYNSASFDKEEMKKLQKKTDQKRTWKNTRNYFEDIIYGIENNSQTSEAPPSENDTGVLSTSGSCTNKQGKMGML